MVLFAAGAVVLVRSKDAEEISTALFQTLPPITRSFLGMHDRYDPYSIRLFQVNHGIREYSRKMPSGGWIE